MIESLISGKLQGQPEERTAKTGRKFVTARMRVAAGEESHFARLTAFSETACAALLALGDGDAVAVAGTLKVGVWTPEGGEPRPNLDMVAAQVLTVYALQRRREAAQAGSEGPARQPAAAARPARRQAPPQRSPEPDGDFGAAGDDEWLRGAP
jgi:single-stranded DNA-binding protein